MKKHDLDHFFLASSVAIIGASSDSGKAGNQIVKNIVDVGYTGGLYPVHPELEEVYGQPCYKDLKSIPNEVELIVVCIPAHGILNVMEQARERGDVKAAVIVAAGFSETCIPERVKLEEDMLKIAKSGGIRIFGPNCVGVINTSNHLDTTFALNIKQIPRMTSFISQSGATGASILIFAGDQPVPFGFNKWAHVGNMSDVDVLEILEYYGEDEQTRVIGMYMEGVKDGRRFLETAKKVAL